VRFVAADRSSVGGGEGRSRRAVIDPAGTLPGRGAYLCTPDPDSPARANPDCLRLAERRRGIARALRCAVTLDPEFVESTKRVAQSAEGRLAETGTRAEGACHPASVGPLALSKS
jgi:predicted RNA-binding protein YlxR (DUF448 family)